MNASLFVEYQGSELAFYINGNLQFHTADEAIYHEYLVVPALMIALQRFPNSPLRVLVCGGGDGLAVRDILRFAAVQSITVVDYDPEVVALGQTEFVPYNQGSLLPASECQGTIETPPRVNVQIQDAFAFVQAQPHGFYHVVIGDFTCPTRPEEMTVFSLEWFTQVHRVLDPKGVLALNGVSPEQTPTAYWCLYQTLMAAGLQTKPMLLSIPSFHHLDYGHWGFFLGSSQTIESTEFNASRIPTDLQVFEIEKFNRTFQFPAAIASIRQGLKINTLEHPHLFYYLLNPPQIPQDCPTSDPVNFLHLCEMGTGQYSTVDEMKLETIAQRWLAMSQTLNLQTDQGQLLQQLMPVQHYSQKPEMMQEWLGHIKSLLAEVDPQLLSEHLLAQAQTLPPKLAENLRQMVTTLREGKLLTQLSTPTTELMTILTVTLLMANIATPEAVFAKGGTSNSSGWHSTGSTSTYYEGGQFGWFGFWMMAIGGFWLYQLYKDPQDSR